MTLSLRGRRLAFGLAATVAFSAGATAQLWNPYTRAAEQTSLCPSGSHLVAFEDGSGGCYADGGEERYPIKITGAELVWPENTFPWDCRTMGNRRCGGTIAP